MLALFFMLALGVLVPLHGAQLEVRESRKRLAWISVTLLGPLAELLGRPPTAPPPPESPFVLGDPIAPLRIDAIVDPSCPACGNALDELDLLVQTHPRTACVFVHLPTRNPREAADRELRVGITAAASLAAFHAARDRGPELLDAARAGAASVLSTLGIVSGNMLGRIDAARAAQAGADLLADTLQRVTPTLLVDGRPWGRTAWELELLLSCYPERFPRAMPGATAPSGSAQAVKTSARQPLHAFK